MPWQFEDVANEVSQGAEHVKKSLNNIVEAADRADKSHKRLSKTQESAIKISKKFEKATVSSSKALSLFGRSSSTAVKGLKAVGIVSKSTAASLASIGAGAVAAASGFKAITSESEAFSSGISGAETSISGLAAAVKGLGPELKDLNLSSGVAKSLRNLTVPPSQRGSSVAQGIISGKKANISKAAKPAGKLTSKLYMDELLKNLKSSSGRMKNQLDILKGGGDVRPENRQEFIDISVRVAGEDAFRDFVEYMEKSKRDLFEAEAADPFIGVDKAIDNLIDREKELGLAIKIAKRDAQQAAEEMTSQLATLERQAAKEAKTLGDVLGKAFAGGGIEAANFADGLGKNATGMMAAGLAGAFLASKISGVIERFTSAAMGLAKYRVETAALGRTISGLNSGALEKMRKSLGLTRDQANQFFDVVKRGVNELGMSQSQIMKVSKALQETFGGDQTERLKQYVDLLSSIPTIETDLKITASMDDQTAAIFGLAESGKMDLVVDLQTAGLLGGSQKKAPEADALNAAQRTAAASENVEDFLMNTLYPEMGPAFTKIVDWASKGATAILGLVGAFGAFQMLTGKQHVDNLKDRGENTTRLVNAITTAAVQTQTAAQTQRQLQLPLGSGPQPELPGMGGAGMGTKPAQAAAKELTNTAASAAKASASMAKMAKMVSIATIATVGVEYGLGALSDKLEASGDRVGAAGAKLTKSLVGIAGFAATGFMMGGPWGAAIGSVVGLVAEFSNLSKVAKTLWTEFSTDAPAVAGKQMSEINERVRMQQSKLVKSGLALQGELEKNKKAFESLKFQIFEANDRIAKLKIENLSQLGGSAESFSSAINAAADNTKKRFAEERRVSDQRRKEIMARDAMGANERQRALADLHERELKAVSQFTSAMKEIIDALFKSPQIIQAGLKSEIGKTMMGFGEFGGYSREETSKKQAVVFDALDEELNGVIEAATKGAEEYGNVVEDMERRRISAEKAISDEIDAVQSKRVKGLDNERVAEVRRQIEAAKADKAAAEETLKDTGLTTGIGYRMAGAAGAGIGLGNMGEEMAQTQYLQEQIAALEKKRNSESKIAALEKEAVTELSRQAAEEEEIIRLRSVMGEGDKPDYAKVKSALADVVKSQSALDDEIAKAQKTIVDNLQIDGVGAAVDLAKRLKGAEKEVQDTSGKLETARASGEGFGEAEEAKNKAEASATELREQLEDAKKAMVGQLKKAAKSFDDDTINKIVGQMVDSEGGLGDIEKIWRSYPGFYEAVGSNIEATLSAVQDINQRMAKKDVLVKQEEILRGLSDGFDMQTAALNQQLLTVQEVQEKSKKTTDAILGESKFLDDTLEAQRVMLGLAESSASMSSMVSDGIKENKEAAQQRLDLASAEADIYASVVEKNKKLLPIRKAAVDQANEEYRIAEEAFEAAKKTGDKAKIATAEQKKNLAASVQGARIDILGATEEAIKRDERLASEARNRLGKIGDLIDDGVSRFNESMAGIRLRNMEELSGAIAELSEYSGDVAAGARESFDVAKKALKERLDFERSNLDQYTKLEVDAIKKRANEAAKSAQNRGETDPAVLEAIRQRVINEGNATLQSKTRLKNAQIEKDYKSGVVEAAKRSKELRESELDIQQGLIDDAMSFASDFGGSFASIMELQKMNVDVARQQLDIAKETRDNIQAAFDSAAQGSEEQKQASLALFRANAEVAAKTLGLRRKELGVQKDMMDRMLGAVFGELTGAGGGRRKNFGSDQALMGVEATRMKTAGGMFVDVPGGAPGTIEERANKRQFGKGMAMPEQGALGEVMKALGTTPNRKPEDKLADAMSGTQDNTKRIAEATEKMAGMTTQSKKATESTQKLEKTENKSLAVDKKEAVKSKESLRIAKRNTVATAKMMKGGKFDPFGKTLGSTDSRWAGRKTLEQEQAKGRALVSRGWGGTSPFGGASGMGVASKGVAAATTAGTSTGMASKAAGTAVVPPLSGTQAATAPTESKGAATTEGMTCKVTGEMLVKFDNKMFKDQVASVVGELMKTPEIAKAIQSQAFK